MLRSNSKSVWGMMSVLKKKKKGCSGKDWLDWLRGSRALAPNVLISRYCTVICTNHIRVLLGLHRGSTYQIP